jgi:hypothetical protein
MEEKVTDPTTGDDRRRPASGGNVDPGSRVYLHVGRLEALPDEPEPGRS